MYFSFILKSVLLASFFCSAVLMANSKQASVAQNITVPHFGSFELITKKTSAESTWELPLSKYQKVDGFWRLADSVFLNGELSQHIFLIRSPGGFKKIADFYQAWARQKNLSLLFSCEGRSCGYSNDWANRFFKNKRLNGLSGKQIFLAVKRDKVYAAVYLVERPTGQILLAIDNFREATAAPITP